MATKKKKTAAKKKTLRAPRQVWLTVDANGAPVLPYLRKSAADATEENKPEALRWRVVGPYVLAERARES